MRLTRFLTSTLAASALSCTAFSCARAAEAPVANAPAANVPIRFRPPAVPLVTSDPFLSIWSEADRLTDDVTRHWTHHEHALVSLIRVDGHALRLMGNEPAETPALPQTSVQVLPTRSIYNFEGSGVHVTLTFTTPALPHDLDVLSRPVTYLTWDVRSIDGAAHNVSLYCSASSQLAVNTPAQQVEWRRQQMGALTSLRAGTPKQGYFDIAGDDARLDWGYAYLAAPSAQARGAIGSSAALISSFSANGTLPADDTRMPRAANDEQPTLAFALDLGHVGAAAVSRHLMIGYDEVYQVKFFGQRLRPYWRRNGAEATDLFQAAERDYPSLMRRCAAFDSDLMSDLTRSGGARYAQMGALAYRQSLAGNGLAADANKQPLLFTKENTSNGDIATVDVIFPMDPMMILFSPSLAKASIVPVLVYGASPRWRFPNAPHDLGTYPIARGTDDGGEQMPVEESGNILIICDAIAKEEGNANFVSPWWPKLSQWAQYLEQYGQDPEDQLCTDDFMGHLAHNSNLSIKAIVALAAYSDLCRRRGETANATKYLTLAKGFAQHWMQAASDGNHSRLAFDKPNSWSQKYNLVWDKILGLNVFPASVSQQEVAHYKAVLQPYGVPLDSRTKLTKSDWTLWSATLADNQADFEALTSPMYDYLNETSARLPFVDSYITDNVKSDGMHARPVIGGIFVKMLADPALWKKWSSGDTTNAVGWAPLPAQPIVREVVATSQAAPVEWRYTTSAPPADWTGAAFDDSGWKSGAAPIGTIPGSRTPWNATPGDLWVRRTFTMPAGTYPNLQLLMFHDEDVEVYINGVEADKEAGYNTGYEALEINPQARALLKPGAQITIAAHVHQTDGGQGIDIGLANVTAPAPTR